MSGIAERRKRLRGELSIKDCYFLIVFYQFMQLGAVQRFKRDVHCSTHAQLLCMYMSKQRWTMCILAKEDGLGCSIFFFFFFVYDCKGNRSFHCCKCLDESILKAATLTSRWQPTQNEEIQGSFKVHTPTLHWRGILQDAWRLLSKPFW